MVNHLKFALFFEPIWRSSRYYWNFHYEKNFSAERFEAGTHPWI